MPRDGFQQILSDNAVANLRSLTARLTLPHTCLIERPVETPDGSGGRTMTYQTVGANVPCLYEVKSGTEGREAGAILWQRATTVTMGAEQDVQHDDRITITTDTDTIVCYVGGRIDDGGLYPMTQTIQATQRS